MRLPILALVLVACGDPPDGTTGTSDTRDASETRDATSLEDAGPTGPDVDEPQFPPAFAKYGPSFPWAVDVFHLEADRRHFVTAINTSSEPGGREYALVRVDGITGETTPGPAIDPETTRLESFPSAAPGVEWLFGVGGSRLSTFEPALLAIGPALELPQHERVYHVIWNWDFSVAAIAHGASRWDGVTVVDLPPDPQTFVPEDTAVEDVPIDPADFIHLRITSGGRFLVLADAPSAKQPGCFLCFDEPDEARARFRVFDLASEDPGVPVLSEAGGFDTTFRVSARGRWLFRDTGDVGDHTGPVVATDLDDPLLNRTPLPCGLAGAMVLGSDDSVLCAGPTGGGWQVVLLDGDLETQLSVAVSAPTPHLIASGDMRRVLIGDELVDLATDPPAVTAVAGLGSRLYTVSDGDWIWALGENGDYLRLRWDDPTPEPLPISSGSLLVQLNSFEGGGYALVRLESQDRIELFGPDGTARGVIDRRPEWTPR